MLPRAYRVNSENTYVQVEANEFFFQENKINKEKLDEGIKKGQHHKPIMRYNTRQLKLFIKTILNPILKALNEYNGLCDT